MAKDTLKDLLLVCEIRESQEDGVCCCICGGSLEAYAHQGARLNAFEDKDPGVICLPCACKYYYEWLYPVHTHHAVEIVRCCFDHVFDYGVHVHYLDAIACGPTLDTCCAKVEEVLASYPEALYLIFVPPPPGLRDALQGEKAAVAVYREPRRKSRNSFRG